MKCVAFALLFTLTLVIAVVAFTSPCGTFHLAMSCQCHDLLSYFRKGLTHVFEWIPKWLIEDLRPMFSFATGAVVTHWCLKQRAALCSPEHTRYNYLADEASHPKLAKMQLFVYSLWEFVWRWRGCRAHGANRVHVLATTSAPNNARQIEDNSCLLPESGRVLLSRGMLIRNYWEFALDSLGLCVQTCLACLDQKKRKAQSF